MSFGPFSTLANGLPNLFGLTGQATPKAMGELLQMTGDLMPFIAGANCMETIGGSPGSVNAVGTYNLPGLVVPSTEGWLVLGYSAGWATLVGEVLYGRLLRGRQTALGNVWYQEDGQGGTRTAGVSAARICSLSGPFLLYPGDVLGISVEAFTSAGTISIFQQAAIYRFTV